MPSKTEEYLALAQRTANGLTRYWESWTDYLTTASRLYKYSFPDQLMIYAQRPDATACADYDIWNNRMNRYVRRGSKGIALLDQSSNVPRLHYVFDVSDTGVRRNSRDPEVWQLNDDLFQPVSEMLAQEYGIHHERLSQQIADIAGKLAESYWDNNSTDILAIVDGSFLMDYDDAGQELQFKSAAAISIMYTILERCGFEPEGYFDRDDFQAIYDFSTPDAVYASVDNMLCVTNDGRKIGLDVRLMNPMLPDDPNSKLNVCVRNVLKIWEEGKDQKLTQLLFCDLSTPKNDGNFNVYDDIRKKLIAAGVPESEIEFIHNADTEAKKATLFSKVRSGDVRVLLGSTAKMGAGTNVQQRLVAVHHLDVGWKPSDMTQRNGRIIRQGNMNKEVKVFNYVTEGTFDSYLFQTLENKQRFISQIMTSKSPVRSCDDVDEQALSYAEIKALCAGNPLIKEKMDLDVQVAKLKVLKADHQSQKFRLEDKLLTKFPAEIQEQTAKIAALKSDAEIAAVHPQDKENFCGMVIKGMTYDEKKTAGERLILACMELPNTEEQVVGSYRGFELSLRFDTFHNEHQALLKGTLKYPVPLGSDPHGNIVRLDNALSNFADRSTAAENELDTLRQQQAAAQVEVAKPFPQEEELAQKSARLAELNAQLDVDEKHHEPEQDEEEKEDAPRRSVLAVLEEKAEKAEPVKPFKSYLDKDGDAR